MEMSRKPETWISRSLNGLPFAAEWPAQKFVTNLADLEIPAVQVSPSYSEDFIGITKQK